MTTDPAFQQWMKDLQAMSADDQAAAVLKKLIEVNPGYDGVKLHKVVNDAVNLWEFRPDAQVADIAPIAALQRLQYLNCAGSPPPAGRPNIRNIEALSGLPLRYLNLSYSEISDLVPVQGMSLHDLYVQGTQVGSLKSLQGMTSLQKLNCSGTPVSDLSPLEKCSRLVSLDVTQTKVTAAGVAALQAKLPNCKIEWDDPAKPAAATPTASGTK